MCCKEDSLSNLSKLGAKGLSGLLRVSRKLGGGLIGADYASIQYVHSECRKQYTHPTNVLLKRKRKLEDEALEPLPPMQLQNEGVNQFNRAHCLSCGSAISKNDRLPSHLRRAVSEIRTLSDDRLKEIARNHRDTWGLDVLGRLEGITDSFAEEGRSATTDLVGPPSHDLVVPPSHARSLLLTVTATMTAATYLKPFSST